MKSSLTQERLRALFSYDPETGVLTWQRRAREGFASDQACATWNTRYAGTNAGHIKHGGYMGVTVDGWPRLAHRLIWLYLHGVEADDIDHINGIRSDNRLANLRDVSHMENSRNLKRRSNNRSGIVGVSWDKRCGKWHAQIRVNYRAIQLGDYRSKDDAVAARHAAELQHGFHPNHGRA